MFIFLKRPDLGIPYLDDGRMIEVSLTGREGAIGLPPCINPRAHQLCFQVSQPGEVLRIESSVLRQLVAGSGTLILLHSYLENYIGRSVLSGVQFLSPLEDDCTWLLMLHDRFGTAC